MHVADILKPITTYEEAETRAREGLAYIDEHYAAMAAEVMARFPDAATNSYRRRIMGEQLAEIDRGRRRDREPIVKALADCLATRPYPHIVLKKAP